MNESENENEDLPLDSDAESVQSDSGDDSEDDENMGKSQYLLRKEELAATAAALLDQLDAQGLDSDTELEPTGKKGKKQKSKRQQKLDQLLDELEAKQAEQQSDSDSEPEVTGGKKGKKKKKNRRKAKVEAACTYDTSRHREAIPEAIRVVSKGLIAGLVSRPDLNGTICELLEFDTETGRQVVVLPDGSKMKLKQANLQEYTEEQRKLDNEKFFKEGEKPKPVKKNKKKAKMQPVSHSKAREDKTKEQIVPAAFAAQTGKRAKIAGLVKQPQLNGLLCDMVEYDPTGRWIVVLDNGTKMKLKPANLEECSEEELVAAAEEMSV